MVDDVVERLGPVVEGRHGRGDDGAHLGQPQHVAQVNGVQRRLARHEHKLAAFLQHDVGGARQQVRGNAVGDLAQTTHGAGRHDHAEGAERAAGDRRREIVDAIGCVGQSSHVGHFQLALVRQGDFRRARHHQMAFHRKFFQGLQQAHAVDDAGSPGNTDNQPRWVRHADHLDGLFTGRKDRLIRRDSSQCKSHSFSSATISEVAREHSGPHRSAQGQARFP